VQTAERCGADKICTRTVKLLTRRGVLIDDQGSTYVAANDADLGEVRDVSFAADNSMA